MQEFSRRNSFAFVHNWISENRWETDRPKSNFPMLVSTVEMRTTKKRKSRVPYVDTRKKIRNTSMSVYFGKRKSKTEENRKQLWIAKSKAKKKKHRRSIRYILVWNTAFVFLYFFVNIRLELYRMRWKSSTSQWVPFGDRCWKIPCNYLYIFFLFILSYNNTIVYARYSLWDTFHLEHFLTNSIFFKYGDHRPHPKTHNRHRQLQKHRITWCIYWSLLV